MTIVRGIFLAALMMLTVGSIAIHSAVAPFFARAQPWKKEPTIAPTPTAIATTTSQKPRPRATPAPRSTSTPRAVTTTTVSPATATARPSETVTPVPTARPKHYGRRARVKRMATPQPTAAATATAMPLATATSGTISLSNYWVGSTLAQRGQTVSIGYVIDNGTGQTVRVMLGASVKASSTLSWSASLADPFHDVVAVVPPGATTHVRYFTLPAGLRPGSYDIAWGLRDPATGQREALIFSSGVMRVSR
jgi:hypothetical protein